MIPNSRLIPLGQLAGRLSELDLTRLVVVYGRGDQQASIAANILLNAGYNQVKVLRGGINSWAAEIDRSQFQY